MLAAADCRTGDRASSLARVAAVAFRQIRSRPMSDVTSAFAAAFGLLAGFDADLFEIVARSLHVSVSAVLIAALIGLPLGAALALYRFAGHGAAIVLLNALMGLPPVVVGLVVYLMLSRSGPLGVFGLLFTPTAMIVAQAILVLPIVAALTRQIVEELWSEYAEQLRSLGARPHQALPTLLWDARFSLVIVMVAGFGRAIAEVGAVMIVGGNIDHVTRVMTTAIALETSKGSLALALGLGIVLLVIAFAVNSAVHTARVMAARRAALA
jgi:tungstate transport system permease protein